MCPYPPKSVSFSSLSKSLESTNPSIISSKLQILLANEEINASKSSLYPRLSLSANIKYQEIRRLNRAQVNFSGGFALLFTKRLVDFSKTRYGLFLSLQLLHANSVSPYSLLLIKSLKSWRLCYTKIFNLS